MICKTPSGPTIFGPACAQSAAKAKDTQSWKTTIEWIRLAGVEVVGAAVETVVCRVIGSVVA